MSRRPLRLAVVVTVLAAASLLLPSSISAFGGGLNFGDIIRLLFQAITGNLPTPMDFIPPRIRGDVHAFAEPYADPGFDEPSDNPVSHDGNPSTSHNGSPGFYGPPGGGSPLDGSGATSYEQVAPDGGAAPAAKQDSYEAF